MTKILLLNGPNLQLLGRREPEIYGRVTLDEIVAAVTKEAAVYGAEVEAFQSNWEGALVDRIGGAMTDGTDGIIINPAALTHTSVAVRDALAAVHVPAVEVHLSHVDAREPFRQVRLTTPVCIGVIAGFGAYGYILALQALMDHLKTGKKQQRGNAARKGVKI